jgi:sugar phosphate isomerase/epimerase
MNKRIGIFTKIFARPRLEDALAAIAAQGLVYTQFNLSCAGLPSLPDAIDPAVQTFIREAFTRHEIHMAAISGTYNMIHPDPVERAAGLHRLQTLIEACSGFGVSVVTLCTGTRDPENMWRGHPANSEPAAWNDLAAALEIALPTAEAKSVVLAFEPEPANVIDRPAKARRLLDEFDSPSLKVVMDGANLFHPGDLARIPEVLREAFDLLGGDIALAHAKDLDAQGRVVAAGKGVLDFRLYVDLLDQAGYAGPVILHSLAEDEVQGSAATLSAALDRFHPAG